MTIPEHYKKYCENPKVKVVACEYFMHNDCPGTCDMAHRLKQGISHLAETGLDRFHRRYPDYELGIGATVVPPKGLSVKAMEKLDNGGLQL